MADCEENVAEYRRIVHHDEEQVRRRELERRIEADQGNVPTLTVSEAFLRSYEEKTRSVGALAAFVGVLLRRWNKQNTNIAAL